MGEIKAVACIKCKFAQPILSEDYASISGYKCLLSPAHTDPVSGYTSHNRCEFARSKVGACGPEGKLFVKATILDFFKSLFRR